MKFRLVDRITAWEARRSIRGVKAVSFEEYRLKAAFGDEPHLPETLVTESLFQLGNWLVMLSSDFTRMGMIVRFEQVRFDAPLLPGERLDMEVTVRQWRDDGIQFDGVGLSAGRAIIAGRGALAVPVPLADYCDPQDLRVLYSEIHRPEEAADHAQA